jgi:predicted MPP superfamily phosphohydrolase
MTFFGIWAPILPSKYEQKYRYGLKQFGETQSYISSGVGTITPPFRFFCRPEIVLITLQNN